jgi:multidrug efflux pump subunit AcrB
MDRKTGVAYQVQVQVPQNQIQSMEALKHFPIMQKENHEHPLLGDVASVTYGKCVGEYDRDNMMRMVSLTANIKGMDLGHVGEEVKAAIARAGSPPRSVRVKVAGQVPVLSDTFSHLFIGLSLALVVIFLMLTGYFQSIRLALIVLSTAPAIVCGVMVMLKLTGTTLNIESFMGAIMSIGIGVSNAILLVNYAENSRLAGKTALDAALFGAQERLRPILDDINCYGIGYGTDGTGTERRRRPERTAGTAVIGGLTMSTLTALTILPLVFAVVQRNSSTASPSIHPDDRGE